MAPGRRRRLRGAGSSLARFLQARRQLSRAMVGTVGTGLVIQLTLVGTGVLLARALGPVDRGQLAFLTLIAALAWQLGPMGVPRAVTYYVARDPAHARAILDRIRKPYRLQIAVTVLVTAIVLAVVTAGRPGYVQVGALIVLAILPSAIGQQMGFAVMQALRMFKPFNLLRILRNGSFLLIGGALYLAGLREFIPLMIAWAVGRIIGARLIRRKADQGVSELTAASDDASVPSVREVRKFGRQALLGSSSPVETFHLDQAAVALFLAPVSLGYYVVALAFTNLPRFIGQAIGLVANPYVTRKHVEREALRMMWKFTALGATVLVPLIVGIWLAAPTLVPFFFGEEFSDSIGVVRILLVGSIFYGIRRVLSDGARGAGRPLIGSVAEVLSVGVAIVLFPILIPAMGLDGAAFALLVASIVALLVLVVGLLRPSRNDEGPRVSEAPRSDPL